MRDRNGVIFIYFPVIPNVTSPGTIYHGWIQDCMESIMQYLGSPGVDVSQNADTPKSSKSDHFSTHTHGFGDPPFQEHLIFRWTEGWIDRLMDRLD